jgi:hypothetical protein
MAVLDKFRRALLIPILEETNQHPLVIAVWHSTVGKEVPFTLPILAPNITLHCNDSIE